MVTPSKSMSTDKHMRARIDAMVEELYPIVAKHFPEHIMITDTSHIEYYANTNNPILKIWLVANLAKNES